MPAGTFRPRWPLLDVMSSTGRPMPSFGAERPPGLIGGLLRSYAEDLKGWTTGLVIRYVIAVVLLLSAGAGLIAAAGVGVSALFHWLAALYGTRIAYAAVIGGLVLLSLVSALAAILLFKRALPPLPRPRRRDARAVNRSVAAETLLTASAPPRALLKADATTEIMIGLAAACLVGWLASSRLSQSRATSKIK